MSTMNRSLRAISAQVDDAAKNASTLEHLSIIETNATEAMALKPEKLAQVPEAEQTKFLEDFQAGIKALLVTVGELRTAVAEGRNADAAKLVDGIKAQQKEGHAEFRIRKAGAP